MITMDGPFATIEFDDGIRHTFHVVWLRESSPHPDNKDPVTGHRLNVAAFLPSDLSLVSAKPLDDAIFFRFNDGHECRYPLAALRRAAGGSFPPELVGEQTLWDNELSPLPWHQLEDLANDPHRLLSFLRDVARFGVAFVKGIPMEMNGMHRLTNLLGFIRLTNSGGIADVKSIARAYDLSMTPKGLEPHVDNPYRVPQPGYTMLHCLENDADGGESILIDGFRVAETLRAECPELFDTLVSTPVTFRYVDDQAILENTVPFIELWPDGTLKQTRFHGRADQVVCLDPESLDKFYVARRAYAELIWSEGSALRLKLNPGEMYFVDNFRIFHGREPFRLETGSRHMRQAYMDRDVVSSRQKTLLRDINAIPWQPRDHSAPRETQDAFAQS